jgi:hypothetical protein
MTNRAAWLLRISSIWVVWVWAVLIRNMVEDRTHAFSFRAVHIGLAIVSIAFAVMTWVIAGRSRRATKALEANQRPAVPAGELDSAVGRGEQRRAASGT